MPHLQTPLHVALENVILSATPPRSYKASHFHGSTAVAPLKHATELSSSTRHRHISTAQQPWPH